MPRNKRRTNVVRQMGSNQAGQPLEATDTTTAAGLAEHLADTDNPHEVTNEQLAGYWAPLTNGDPVSPEILFDSDGTVSVAWVPVP